MTGPWHSVEADVLLRGDYARVLLQEDQRQLLLVSSRNLWVYDLDTLEVNQMLALDNVRPRSAHLDASKRTLYLGTEYGDTLVVVDLHAFKPTAVKLKTGCRDLVPLSAKGQLYWLGHQAMSVVSLRDKKSRVTRQIPLKGDHYGVCLALSPDEQTLAVGRNGKGELYRAENYSFKSNIDLSPGVHQLAFSPDGRFLAGGGGLIHSPRSEEGEVLFDRIHESYYADARLIVWDASTGRVQYRTAEQPQPVRCLTWHPHLPLLATPWDLTSIQLWALPDQGDEGELIATDTLHLPSYHGQARDLTFTSDGAHLLVTTDKGLVEFRLDGVPSLRQPRVTVHQPLHTTATPLFSPDEGRWHDGQLWFNNARQWGVYDPASRTLVNESPVDEHAFALHVSPHHQKVLRYRSNNSEGHRIEIRTLDGEFLSSIRDIPLDDQQTSPGYASAMRLEEDGVTVTFAQDARLLRASWNAPGERIVQVFEQGNITHSSFDTPSALALTSAGIHTVVRLWNTLTQASMVALEPWQIQSLSGYITKLHLNAQCLLAIGTSKGEVRVYDLTSGLQVMRGARHGDGIVHDLSFSDDGTLLVSAAEDGTVRLWDVRSGDEIAVFQHVAPVHLVCFSLSRPEVISIDQHGTIFTWDTQDAFEWRDGVAAPVAATPEPIPPELGSHAALTEQDQYFADAARGQLRHYAERSWALLSRTPPHQTPPQGSDDLVEAYRKARRHAPDFAERLRRFGEAHGTDVRLRPGTGIKDANRSVEKLLGKARAAPSPRLPTDLLGGTLIVDSVARMYEVAEQLNEAFEVVGFSDRMIYRAKSKYGDLQFSVSLDGHLAEVKIVHRLFQQIDLHEHRIYEIQRELDAEFADKDLPLAERFVGEALEQASQRMYTEAWTWITAQEEGLDD